MAPHASAPAALAPAWRSAIALLALTGFAWAAVPGGSFQYDDRASALVQADPGLRIRPLLALSWEWDRTVHGERAAGWLLENLLLHGLTVLVVLALGRRLLSPLGAFLAAAAFALQPAHAEIVAYVSGRSTGLMALLLLAALWIWRPGSRWRLVGAGVLFAAAVAVKEVALVFPLLLLLWARASEGPAFPLRRLAGFGMLAGVLALAVAAIPRYRALAAWSLAERGPLQSLAVNVAVLPEQLSLWFRPWASASSTPLPPADRCSRAPVPGRAPRRGLDVPAPGAGVTLASPGAGGALPTQSVLAKADVLTEKPLISPGWVRHC